MGGGGGQEKDTQLPVIRPSLAKAPPSLPSLVPASLLPFQRAHPPGDMRAGEHLRTAPGTGFYHTRTFQAECLGIFYLGGKEERMGRAKRPYSQSLGVAGDIPGHAA